MYETRGYPVDVIVRGHRQRDRAQRRAYRFERAVAFVRRLSFGRAAGPAGPR